MNLIKVYGLFLLIMAMMPGQVFAHALWNPGSITPPRDITDTKLKFGPCGGSGPNTLLSRGIKPKIFKLGETITVEWVETINHKGLFYIDFLNNLDKPLVTNNVIQLTDTKDNILPKLRSQLLTVPQINCPKCSIQLIQEMWFNNDAIRPPEFDGNGIRQRSNYYSCSDIRIESSNNIVPGEVNLPSQSRINNIDNVKLNWTNPSELQNNINNVAYRILILMDTKPIDALPINKNKYTTDQTGTNMIGTAKVVYVGNLETATISGLTNTDKLYFKLFTYNVSNLYSAGVSSNAVAVIPVAPSVSLDIKQGTVTGTSVVQNGTDIIVTGNVTDDNITDTHTFKWTSNDFVDSDQTDKTFTIKGSDIINLPTQSTYTIAVNVTDSSGLSGSNSVDITLKSKSSTPPVNSGNDVINNVADNGGCTVSRSAKFDPVLLILSLLSLIIIGFKSRRTK
jgi:hypothetical protein